MQIVVDSLITTYSRTGKGKIIVMLHGWGESSTSLHNLETKLAQRYEVINLDLPGFGQTEGPKTVWDLEDYAKFVASFLKKLEVKNIHAFIGHSNGGAVLIKGLANSTLKTTKLVLLASAGIRGKQKGRRLALKVTAKAGKAATFFLPERHKRKLRKSLYGAAGSDMLVVPELQETFKKTVSQDIQEDAKRLTLPTLLIYGSNDRATPVEDGKLLNSLVHNSTLKIIEGAGHYVHQEEPQVTLEYVGDFLK